MRGTANGLKHCDINLKDKTITFTPWKKGVSFEKTRRGKRTQKLIRNLNLPKTKEQFQYQKLSMKQ